MAMVWLLITQVGYIHLPLVYFTFNSLWLIYILINNGYSLLNILNTMSMLHYFILLIIIVLRVKLEFLLFHSTAFSYCWFSTKLSVTSYSWLIIPLWVYKQWISCWLKLGLVYYWESLFAVLIKFDSRNLKPYLKLLLLMIFKQYVY